MNSLKKKLYQYYLPKLVKRQCDATIPRSGEKGKKINCYTILFFKGTEPYLIIKNIINDELQGFQWNGSSFKDEASIMLDDASELTLRIEHFYGLDKISYIGIYDYAIERFTRYSYLKIHLNRARESISQHLFNRRSLETKKRFDFLKLLTEKFIDSDNGFSYVSVMSEMHSDRSFLHPEFNQEAKKIEAHLKGFVDTGELKIINHQYYLTGFAFKAIHDYEEQDRKHNSAVWAQWIMIILTLVLAIFTAVQAGLIVLPTLWKLS